MMNSFRKRTATRIAAVSILLASVAGPVSWLITRQRVESNIVTLAIEESRRLIRHHHIIDLTVPEGRERAVQAANSIAGGLFDIVEIFDRDGRHLVRSLTADGEAVQTLLPQQKATEFTTTTFDNFYLPQDRWVLRILIPLRNEPNATAGPVTGYFAGVRVMPEWQEQQIFTASLSVALIACLASLLCGTAIYPVIVRLSADNESKAHEILASHLSLMNSLGRAIAKRDSDTGEHNYRVAWIASQIAEHMGINGRGMQSLIAGSFLHDVGKIGIPDAILFKAGKLDDAEQAVMRTHVTQGEEIVAGSGWLDGAAEVVASHHEKWDGSGYPRKLAGEAIPLAARIFAVADVFDALCSRRPYKEPIGYVDAMAMLEKGSGSHFDPSIIAVFLPMAREIFDRLAISGDAQVRRLLEDRVRQYFRM